MTVTKTVTQNGASITVRRATIRDRLNETTLRAKLHEDAYDDIQSRHRREFGAILAHTVSVEGLEFTLPDVGSSTAELEAALEQFLSLPGEIYDLWLEAIIAVRYTGGDPDLAPTAAPVDAETKKKEANGSDK